MNRRDVHEMPKGIALVVNRLGDLLEEPHVPLTVPIVENLNKNPVLAEAEVEQGISSLQDRFEKGSFPKQPAESEEAPAENVTLVRKKQKRTLLYSANGTTESGDGCLGKLEPGTLEVVFLINANQTIHGFNVIPRAGTIQDAKHRKVQSQDRRIRYVRKVRVLVNEEDGPDAIPFIIASESLMRFAEILAGSNAGVIRVWDLAFPMQDGVAYSTVALQRTVLCFRPTEGDEVKFPTLKGDNWEVMRQYLSNKVANHTLPTSLDKIPGWARPKQKGYQPNLGPNQYQVKWYDLSKGYGCLARPGEDDIVVSWDELASRPDTDSDFKFLLTGETVHVGSTVAPRGDDTSFKVEAANVNLVL